MQLNFLKKFKRIPVKEKIFFVQHLEVMLKAGISLAEALKTLSLQTENKRFKEIIVDITQGVEKGEPLSNHLAKYNRVFDNLFVNMIKAGEASGQLENVLRRIYIQMKKDHELRSKVKGAMIYPAVVVFAMIVIGTLMIVFVIPKITAVFKEAEVTLPLPTRVLMATSEFVIQNYLVVIIALIGLIYFFFKLISTKRGKYIFHSILLRLPIIASIIKKINLARFSRTFSSLLKTDIPIMQTLDITANILGNVLYKEEVLKASRSVTKGISLGELLKKNGSLFPPVVTQMILVGEQTGSLDNVLEELAEFYENDIDQIMKNLPSIIEPVLILILGVAVAGMAIAVIMPMYSLTQAI
ncbi:MAG: type II secretion system F family protein [bacterium]